MSFKEAKGMFVQIAESIKAQNATPEGAIAKDMKQRMGPHKVVKSGGSGPRKQMEMTMLHDELKNL